MKTLVFEDSSKLYFTSDSHLGHSNIIRYCNRPFANIEEMDKTIIDNWNSIVKEDDTVFILGDFCWRMGDKQILWYLDQLIGNKILILGNHDKNEKVFIKHNIPVYDGFINIRVKDKDATEGYQRLTLCHYPMLSWYQSHRGAWQLFGHMHNATLGKLTEEQQKSLEESLGEKEAADFMKTEYKYLDKIRYDQYDVGVDGNSFIPISYFEIKEIINGKIKR